MLGLYLQQGVPDTGELTFVAEEREDGRNQQHRFPQDELTSLPMIKRSDGCQRADKKEADLAKTQQQMTQYDSMTEPDLRLKTASVPISRLHYHETHHRDRKVLRRTCH